MLELLTFDVFVFLSFSIFYPQLEKSRYSPQKIIDSKEFSLSDREIFILEKLLSGEKYTTIARINKCAVITVKKQVAAICKKLGVADRTELLVKYGGCQIVTTSA